MSTIQHSVGDIASGMPWWRTGSPWFFMVQSLGFMTEHWFQSTVSSVFTKSTRLTRVTGYVWVFLWMFWTTPFYAYPVSAGNKGDPIIPVSLLKPLAQKLDLI